jgi:DNA-binding beta-propeller fold protein YncE
MILDRGYPRALLSAHCLLGFCAALAVAGSLVASRPEVASGQSLRGPAFERSIGRFPESGLLNTPMGVAVAHGDPTTVFVVDYGNARIQVFRTTGRPDLGYWGSRGEGRGQFWKPMDVAVSPDSRFVYVVDAGRARVMQYQIDRLCLSSSNISCTNEVLNEWGSYGSGPGLFRAPTGIAVDQKGRVWVADEGASNIQVFEADGSNPRIFSGPGSEIDQLNHPRDIEVGPDGNIWVTDTEKHRVVVFDPEGQVVTQVTGGAERFHKPTGIALGPNGSFIVRDFDPSYRQPRLWRYASLSQLEAPPLELEGFDKRSRYLLQGVDFLPDGGSIIANPYSGVMRVGQFNEFDVSLYLLPPGRNELQPLAVRGEEPGQFAHPMAVAIDGRLVVVADTDNQRIQILDSELGYAASRIVGAPELAFEEPSGVAIHRGLGGLDSRIYVSDRGRNSIFVLNPAGLLIDRWGDGQPNQFNLPGGLCVNGEGIVFVADTLNNRIVRRAPDGSELGSFGEKLLTMPESVAVGPDDNIYVIERGQARLTSFSPEGNLIARWDAEPLDNLRPAEGEINMPVGLAADDRYLYLLENTGFLHVRTQVLQPVPGKPLADSVVAVFAAAEGAGPGLVDDPQGIAASSDGRVLIADSGNNRLQLFRWGGAITPTPLPPTGTPTDLPTATPSATPSPSDTPTATVPEPTPTDEPPATEPPTPTRPSPSPSPTDDISTRPGVLTKIIYFPQLIRRW